MNGEIDENLPVLFYGNKTTLGEVMKICRTGEPIEGVPPEIFDALTLRFEKDRGKKFKNIIDRRYGEWRFTLMDIPKSKSEKASKPCEKPEDRL